MWIQGDESIGWAYNIECSDQPKRMANLHKISSDWSIENHKTYLCGLGMHFDLRRVAFYDQINQWQGGSQRTATFPVSACMFNTNGLLKTWHSNATSQFVISTITSSNGCKPPSFQHPNCARPHSIQTMVIRSSFSVLFISKKCIVSASCVLSASAIHSARLSPWRDATDLFLSFSP